MSAALSMHACSLGHFAMILEYCGEDDSGAVFVIVIGVWAK